MNTDPASQSAADRPLWVAGLQVEGPREGSAILRCQLAEMLSMGEHGEPISTGGTPAAREATRCFQDPQRTSGGVSVKIRNHHRGTRDNPCDLQPHPQEVLHTLWAPWPLSSLHPACRSARSLPHSPGLPSPHLPAASRQLWAAREHRRVGAPGHICPGTLPLCAVGPVVVQTAQCQLS